MKAFLTLLVGLIVAARQPVASSDEDIARYREMAEVIVRESAGNPLWGDAVELADEGPVPPHVAATATLLLAVAYHESGLRQSVRDCRVRGDNGRSFGAYQLMKGWSWQGYSQEEICGSDALQARLALGVLHRYKSVGPRTTPTFWINGYASGDGGRETSESVGLRKLWQRFSNKAGVAVTTGSRKDPVEKPPATTQLVGAPALPALQP